MSENGSALFDGKFELIKVAFACAVQFQHVDGVMSPLAKDFGKQRPDIFMQQKDDPGHQLAKGSEAPTD